MSCSVIPLPSFCPIKRWPLRLFPSSDRRSILPPRRNAGGGCHGEGLCARQCRRLTRPRFRQLCSRQARFVHMHAINPKPRERLKIWELAIGLHNTLCKGLAPCYSSPAPRTLSLPVPFSMWDTSQCSSIIIREGRSN